MQQDILLQQIKYIGAVYNDYGEILRKNKNETIDYGYLICIREDGLAHKVSTDEDLNKIIGISSDTMGMQLGGADIPKEEQLEVGMLGQMWVYTNNHYLKPGHIVKALPNGTVDITTNIQEKIGIVLSEVEGGKVKIFYK